MTVEQNDKIDFVAFNRKSGDVHLIISDHLDWDENEGAHLLALQDKLNTYLEFVESGQLYVEYSRAIGKKIYFDVIGKFPLSDEAAKFYRLAVNKIREYGYSLEFLHLTGNRIRLPGQLSQEDR
ncbi:MAG TPA: DUF6572 domain-containing protein [Xanthobacteraceae bacterium]|nr:DUF6572 domain-containing protein [Xanthobacteraceae bacterium]